jgi:hypothetical protein
MHKFLCSGEMTIFHDEISGVKSATRGTTGGSSGIMKRKIPYLDVKFTGSLTKRAGSVNQYYVNIWWINAEH